MSRERKPSSKIAFMEASNADYETHQSHLDDTKGERKRPKKAAKGASKGKKAPKDAATGDKPKRPLTAYMHFASAMRAEVKQEYPDASFGEVGKILGEWWQDCSAAEREKYNNLAQAGKPAGSASKSSSGGSSSGKPSYLDMAMIAIKGLKNRKGSSHNAIEAYMKSEWPALDYKRHLLRKALKAAADKGKLERSANSFKIAK